jgi:hypothetical protein
MTVRELQNKLTISEARKWHKFFAERPWPEEARDLQNGILCAIVANLARGKDTPPRTASDFLVFRRSGVEPENKGSEADRFKTGKG